LSARRILAGLAAAAAPAPAFAHAVGERYDLPLPVHLYILGGALTVALSFAIVALVVRTHRAAPAALEPAQPRLAGPALAIVSRALATLGLALLALTIAAGLFGEQHPARNLATTMVWIVWWIGLAFVAAFVADLWPLVNPWRTIARLAAALAPRRLRPRPYPRRWAEWPAVAWLLAFVWLELVYPAPSHPRTIAVAALVYSLATFAGMALFGRETWLRRGEAFTLFFGMLGRFAPIRWHGGALRFRLWGAGLARPIPLSGSMVAFILLMLAAVLFDGFLGTGLWRLIERGVRGLLPYGVDRDNIIAATLSLVGLWLAFLGAYYLACWAMARATKAGMRGRAIASRFALSLVPIGVGYNLAHNLSYLLVQGQAIAALLSDPFGIGWNLFGTAHWQVEIGVIDAGTVWVIALLAIVGGHLISVYLAHVAALHLFARRGTALRALVPLTILMVVYTGISLTVIAEPLVRFRKPDPSYSARTPALPAMAVAGDDPRR
jgi:hypothetical protein